MDESLRRLLKTKAIDYTLVPSSSVSNNSGSIIAIENYYSEDEGLQLSIALSYKTNKWEKKCWLSANIPSDDLSKPKPYPRYFKFEHNQINYYPYSIDTSEYQLLDILKLCDGLYRFVKENHIIKNE